MAEDRALTHNSKTAETEPAWSEVDKSRLPDNAFADSADRRFPHHFVQNGKIGENGVYTSGDMFVHEGGLGAASSAAQGGRSGKKAEPAIFTHLNAHRCALGLDPLVREEEDGPTRSLTLGPMTREAVVEPTDDEYKFSLTFSSETPIQRWFGWEILDHSPEAVDLSRFNTGASVRDGHDGDQIGVVESGEIGDDRKGHAQIRFGKSARAEEIRQDIADKIRRSVSIRYQPHKMRLEKEEEDESTYRITEWSVIHLAVVPDPADPDIGFGRDKDERMIEIAIDGLPEQQQVTEDRSLQNTEEIEMSQEKEKKIPEAAPGNEGLKVEDRNREVTEILAIAERHELGKEAAEHIREGKSLQEFQCLALEKLGAKPVETPDPKIGMSDKEIKEYRLVRAINILANNRALDGLEKEASEAVAKRLQREPKGFFVPFDVQASRDFGLVSQQRALNVTTPNAGGYLVGEDLLGGSLIELLRNNMIVSQMGARNMSGLVGDVAIPKHTGGATAYWLAENAAVTASEQTFGQLALTPHRLATRVPYSKQLLAQASIDVEAFVRQDITTVLAIAKDLAAINGSGADGQPLGIINTTGVSTVTFGGAPSWAKVVEFETDIGTSNALVGSLAYLTTPAVRGKWKTVEKASGTAQFLWQTNDAPVNGYRAEASNQVPSDKVLFGNWGDLIVADWDGMDIVVDPYTLAANYQVRIIITILTDLGVRQPASFSVSTDAGNQ